MSEQYPLFERPEQPALLDHDGIERLVDSFYDFYDHEAVAAMKRLYRSRDELESEKTE